MEMLTQPRAGEVFASRFEIDRVAGSGGMGTVYRARDLFSGDLIALKVLRPHGSDPHEADRFAREGQLLYELRHPGIVNYIAHGRTPDGQRYLAMEWLEGEDLARRLARGPLPVADAVLLLQKIADGLAVAHQRAVVHRDIKLRRLPSGDWRGCGQGKNGGKESPTSVCPA